MVNPDIASAEVLEELGRLTIFFSGLEELFVTFIALFEASDDQARVRDEAARIPYGRKRARLHGLVSRRFGNANVPDLLEAMEVALKICDAAATARNDLVHGLVDYEGGVVFVTRPGREQRIVVNLENVKAANQDVTAAWERAEMALGDLWNTKKGVFE